MVAASTRKYLVLWVIPAVMTGHTINGSNPDHTEPIKVLVLSRDAGTWRTLSLPTVVSSLTQPAVRLLGDWLVTTEMHWFAKRPSGCHPCR